MGSYQLLEAIGKGGFGVVYRGLNLLTGATVAVKRVNLTGIPEGELAGLEMEIQLLKNLSHPNIVKYIDAVRMDEHLNIILEFVENGSLSVLLGKLSKRGTVEEQLVAVYTAQILEGLRYLHQQGVIHRDIKGANILLTKEGVVKLADFGVATSLSDSKKSDSVVGTPYWMAPEIIEMTGQQSSACDIWSVGCTVVELLTGKPPYFDLQQMPALFRIVQDEHPPLPENVSPALTDFLLACFQKDPLRRISATDLLRHPWLKQAQTTRKKELKLKLMEKKSHRALLEQAKTLGVPVPTLDVEELEQADKNGGLVADAPLTVAEIPPAEPTLLSRKSLSSNAAVPGTGNAGVAVRPRNISTMSTDGVNIGSFSKQVGKASALTVAAGVVQAPPAGAGPMSNMVLMGPTNIKNAWVEEDDELDDLGFGDDEEDELGNLADRVAQQSPAKVSGKGSVDDLDELADFEEGANPSGAAEGDVFADLEFDAPDPRVDEEARVARTFHRHITKLNPKEEEETIIEACMALEEMVAENPAAVTRQMTNAGVIPVMEMLEVPNPNIIVAVLKVVNLVIGQDQKFQQNMSLVGLIPAIIRFASPGFPSNIRLEAANFVRHFCYASDFTRKMFVACGGLPVLVGFLEEPYAESKTLVFNSVDCIRHVFEISSNPKNDFCRLFCKYGLLPPLAFALGHVNRDSEHPDAVEYTQKIANVIHLFSNGDATVKQYMAKPQVMEELLHTLPSLAHDVLNLILKSIRNISMEPSTLDLLASAGTIPALIPFLASPYADCQYQVLMAMYYLSRISNTRQEQLARSGVTPHLQRFISENHPMKQFALPIIIQLSKTSRVTRLELRKYNGVAFFLELLSDPYWRTHALDSIALWLADDPRRVEFILIQSGNLIKLVNVLRKTKKSVQFEKILGPFCKILTASQAVNRTLGRNHAFVSEVVLRLETHRDNNNIRMNLLKLLALIFDNHLTPNDFVARYQLVPVLEQVASDRSAVMVAPMARTLLKQMDPASAARLLQAEQVPEVSVSEVDNYR